MSQRPFVLLALLTVVCLSAAQARDPMQGRPDAQRGNMDAPRTRSAQDMDTQQQAELLQRQKRRDDLRETLRVQGEEAAANNPSTARQLSAQERIELRQQLRQQQEWLNK